MIKKILLGYGILALIFTIVLISLNKGSIKPEIKPEIKADSVNDSNIKTVFSTVDMKDFSLDELNSLSQIIVKGKAVEQSYYTVYPQVYTKTKVVVEKAYKGNVKIGDVYNGLRKLNKNMN